MKRSECLIISPAETCSPAAGWVAEEAVRSWKLSACPARRQAKRAEALMQEHVFFAGQVLKKHVWTKARIAEEPGERGRFWILGSAVGAPEAWKGLQSK